MMMKRFGIILLVIGLTGCLGATGSAPPLRQYILEYPTPTGAGTAEVAEMLKVDHFTAARHLAGQAMLYRQGPFRLDAYHDHRWRVAPAEMAADFLRRDLRHAGLFRAVLSPRDAEETRFLLEGVVEEFLEVEEAAGGKALLIATLTLLDLSQRGVSSRVVFQKTYRGGAPLQTEGAAGFAAAMSSAMAELSAGVIADIGEALKRTGR